MEEFRILMDLPYRDTLIEKVTSVNFIYNIRKSLFSDDGKSFLAIPGIQEWDFILSRNFIPFAEEFFK